MKKSVFYSFNQHLRYVAAATWLIDLANIPVSLFVASLLSDIVTSATAGKTDAVCSGGLKLALLFIGYKVFESVYRIKLEQAQSKALHKCKMELYEKFLSNPLSVLYSYDSGQVKERLNDDFNAAAKKITSLYPKLCIGIITAVVYFIFIARLSLITAVVLTIIALIQILPPVIVKKFLEQNYTDTRNIEAEISNSIIEAHHGFAVLKLYHLKQWYLKKLSGLHKKYLKIGNSGIFANTAENTLNQFVSTLLTYGTYAFVGLFTLYGIIALDTGVTVIALSGSFFAAVTAIFSSITRFAVTRRAEKRLSEWYKEDRETTVLSDAEISLSNVSLSFDDQTIFCNLDAVLPAKGVCLIKGANGAGKSTLFKLITGLIQADRGAVTVGGVSPEGFSKDTFPQGLFYLPQEDAEFGISPQEFYRMISGGNLSRITDLAERFGLGQKQLSETKISELSGGERKKVFLALALASSPFLLLLDEPTNALDEASKELLVNELKQRNGLTLIITHDPVFDMAYDHAFFIREGGIELERGQKS